MKIALTIAGSDPSGGAGIQADLKTFTSFDVYGLSAITAYTIQNSTGVIGVLPTPDDHLHREICALFQDFPIGGIKIGMLGTEANVMTVTDILDRFHMERVVLDPVFLSSNNFPLLENGGISTLIKYLLPKTLLVTPNIHEAEIIASRQIKNSEDMKKAAKKIKGFGASNVLIKGGHLEDNALDILYGEEGFRYFEAKKAKKSPLHGTGCVLSSAITAGLVRGLSIFEAVERAKSFVTSLIEKAKRLGKGAYYLI